MFWVGPMSGALIAALVYELTFRPSHDPVRFVAEPHDQAAVTFQGPGLASAGPRSFGRAKDP